MRQLLTRSAWFCAGLLAMFAVLSAWYMVRIDWQDNFTASLRTFEASSQHPRFVFLGDSHPAVDIVLTPKDTGYMNFSFPSENWRDIFIRAKLALQSKPTIPVFVVPVDNVTLSPFRDESDHLVRMLHIASLADIRSIYRPNPVTLVSSILKAAFPLLDRRNRELFLTVILKDVLTALHGGTQTREMAIDADNNLSYTNQQSWTTHTPEERTAIAKANLDHQFEKGFFAPALAPVVDDFLHFADTKRVCVVGIHYPASLEYQKYMQANGADALRSFYAQKSFALVLNEEHVFDDHQEYFLDENHLTHSGALVFTPILLQKLKDMKNCRL